MKALCAILPILGVASGACAGLYGWEIVVSDSVLGPPSSGLPQQTDITVRAKFDASDAYAFATGRFDLVADEVGGVGTNWDSNSCLVPFHQWGADPGTLTVTGATLAAPAQIHFPQFGIFADSSNPAAVWRITYKATDFTPRTIMLETVTDQSYGFWVIDSFDSARSHEIAHDLLSDASGIITIVPSPTSLATIAVCSLVTLKRRR